MSKGVTKGEHGQESKSVRKCGHKKGKQKGVTKPMVCGSMVVGETASTCKEVLEREVTREAKPQKRGSTPERRKK